MISSEQEKRPTEHDLSNHLFDRRVVSVLIYFRAALNVLALVAVFIASAVVVYNYTRVNVHPRTVKAISAENSELRAGDDLIILVLADIHAEICGGVVHRWLIRADNSKPVWEAIQPAQPVTVESGVTIRVAIPLPDTISPGGYYYKSLIYDRRCDDPTRPFPPVSPGFVYFRVLP